MYRAWKSLRLLPLSAVVLITGSALAVAQPDPQKPVTPPDSYRVVMENERVRMIEVHVKPHSKVNVDSPAGRDRFLYMLSDGALILAPPGKTPYEFALHAGETAVFPAVSPTVENDTDSPVRALMVEVKERMRTAATSSAKGKSRFAKGKSRGKFSAWTKSKRAARKSSVRSSKAVSSPGVKPLNLRNANTKPAKKVTGKDRGSDS